MGALFSRLFEMQLYLKVASSTSMSHINVEVVMSACVAFMIVGFHLSKMSLPSGRWGTIDDYRMSFSVRNNYILVLDNYFALSR